jgi:hypothetical protein
MDLKQDAVRLEKHDGSSTPMDEVVSNIPQLVEPVAAPNQFG